MKEFNYITVPFEMIPIYLQKLLSLLLLTKS